MTRSIYSYSTAAVHKNYYSDCGIIYDCQWSVCSALTMLVVFISCCNLILWVTEIVIRGVTRLAGLLLWVPIFSNYSVYTTVVPLKVHCNL